MAVAESVTLPAQPSSGSVTFVPLGGDGFTAPQHAYAIQNMAATGAAGGGALSASILMDPRYVSLVAFATMRLVQAADTAIDVRFVIGPQAGGVQIPQIIQQRLVTDIASGITSSTISDSFNPTPLLLPGAGQAGSLSVAVVNVDTDILNLSAYIYCFNIRVRELTPMGPLLWSRGAT